MTPPPTTTTRAWAGMLTEVELAAVTGSGCPGQKCDLGIILRVSLLGPIQVRPCARRLERLQKAHLLRCPTEWRAPHHTIECDLVHDFTD